MTLVDATSGDSETQLKNSDGAKVSSAKKKTQTRPGARRRSEKSKSVKIKRLQINLSDRAYDRLVRLRDLTDAMSVADVVREALRAYDALIEETQEGKRIVLEDPNKPGEKEILRLF